VGIFFSFKNDYDFKNARKIYRPAAEFLIEGVHIGEGGVVYATETVFAELKIDKDHNFFKMLKIRNWQPLATKEKITQTVRRNVELGRAWIRLEKD